MNFNLSETTSRQLDGYLAISILALIKPYFIAVVKSFKGKLRWAPFNMICPWGFIWISEVICEYKCGMQHPFPLGDNILKSDSHLFEKNCFTFFFIESPLKMIKNTFDFILKALFVLKVFIFIFHIFMTFWSCRRNGLIRKKRLISKSLTSQFG